MYTIVETPVFLKKADLLLSDDERESVAAFGAMNPMAGSVVPGSGGVRKLRWRAAHGGKRGGYRVIYFNRLGRGQIWLLTIFSNRQHERISTRDLVQIRKAIDDEA